MANYIAFSETCVFCSSSAQMTGEHLWPKWLTKHRPDIGYQHAGHAYNIDGTIQNFRANTSKMVSAKNIQLKIVCRNCNNNWMSEIENGAKKHIQHKDTVKNSAISLWAALRAFISQYKHMPTFNFTLEQTQYISKGRIHKSINVFSAIITDYEDLSFNHIKILNSPKECSYTFLIVNN